MWLLLTDDIPTLSNTCGLGHQTVVKLVPSLVGRLISSGHTICGGSKSGERASYLRLLKTKFKFAFTEAFHQFKHYIRRNSAQLPSTRIDTSHSAIFPAASEEENRTVVSPTGIFRVISCETFTGSGLELSTDTAEGMVTVALGEPGSVSMVMLVGQVTFGDSVSVKVKWIICSDCWAL